MELIRIARDLSAIAVMILSLAVLLSAINNPSSYGEWLQQIDNGRYGSAGSFESDNHTAMEP